MLIDLSHTIEHGTVTYPGLPPVVITDYLTREASRSRYNEQAEFRIGRIEMIANSGTYLDAPSHRHSDGKDLSELPLSAVAALPGVLVEATDRVIDVAAFRDVDVHGRAVLVHTGWSRHWGTPAYANQPPFLTAAAAEHLIGEGAVLVGIDALNIDDPTNPARPVHTALLRQNVLIVEHMTNLAALRDARAFTFFAVPVKVRGFDTFPVRAFAMVESP
jgi:arylformamidase